MKRAIQLKKRKDKAFRLDNIKVTDRLNLERDNFDVIVIGSGLAGLTSARVLSQQGYSVLLLEQHYIFGGLATYFKRRGHIFDISLHGFPVGMQKTLRRYWSKELADNIIQVKDVRFDNPQFTLQTTFTREDFTNILVKEFNLKEENVIAFYDYLGQMNFYDDHKMTTRELFQNYFPNREDVWRLLIEPITYANGSSLDDPAISYGIVFSNFMSKGVYIYQGGTDDMIDKMTKLLKEGGVVCKNQALVQEIIVENGKVKGVRCNNQVIHARAVVSNAGLHPTVEMVSKNNIPKNFFDNLNIVKTNNSSCQVYIALNPGVEIPPIGDLLFTSSYKTYDTKALCAKNITSRTFSVYYPEIRPLRKDRTVIVSSTNANYDDWVYLNNDSYQKMKDKMIDETIDALEYYLPNISEKIDYVEASTPRTFEYYSLHKDGTSFGTKFEGLHLSMQLPELVEGLFHTGSVGIIMSGWLGAANYGVIVSNKVDKLLYK